MKLWVLWHQPDRGGGPADGWPTAFRHWGLLRSLRITRFRAQMAPNTWAVWTCLLVLAGCGKDIGDSCKSVNDCITTDTDRLCLTEDGEGFPGGYCSKFNCGGTNVCPTEAACVAYRYSLGGGECSEDSAASRLQRNYCMLRCQSDGDCRDGYKCLSADGDNPLGATIIDEHAGGKVCAIDYVEPSAEPERESEVCEPSGLLGGADAAAASQSMALDAGQTSADASSEDAGYTPPAGDGGDASAKNLDASP